MEFIDLKAQYRALQPRMDERIQSVLQSTRFIGGPEVKELETQLAAFVGRKHCISCANGTEALQLAFMAYGVEEGDAVFCPDMTFISSVEPAVMLGATPVFCDIDPDTYNLDPRSLEAHVEQVEREGKLRPRFVVAVDFLGNPADFEAISRICDAHGLVLIEDAAQATGASHQGKRCGSFGDVATTSFFPSKPLGCYGDGGAVFTDDDETASLLNSLKVHGKGPKGKYDNVRIGLNSRLDTLQAAVLLTKLEVLEDEIKVRQQVARRYAEALSGKLKVPFVKEGDTSAWAQYCVLAESPAQRQKVLDAMKAANVPSLIYYPHVLHKLDAFAPWENTPAPNAEQYADCNFGLPFSPYLTEEDQQKVIDVVLKAL
ncbi:MAG: DegT/DnrJ/EryC1/StrS family aminotransferase [Oscillospiraceae bacterium]|nr:DegT/DnrJ/EryC1/StrS family aminotransferase [Oscillospiraceae bacterium]